MTPMRNVAESLIGHMHNESQAVDALDGVLKKEQHYLIQADMVGLLALTEDKARLVVRVAELSKERYKTLALAGYAANEEGMATWVAKSDTSAVAAWRMLLDVTRVAKEHNRVNGLLISKHMSRSNHALQLLQRKNQHSGVYGPDGQAQTRSISRGITA